MKEKEFDKLMKIMEKLNPKDERITEEEYQELSEAIMLGQGDSYDRLLQLSFYYGCNVLKEEYIDQGKPVQDFEDEASEIYLKLTEGMLNFTCPTLKAYKGYLKQKIQTELTALRAEALEKNAYLNGEWNNNVEEVENEKAQPKRSCRKVKPARGKTLTI